MPKVSIITPTYNHEDFIAECIDSVIKQTFDDWELIIIDDCSGDKTCLIVSEYAARDSRIKFIHHEYNWGIKRLAETYNQALDISKGEFVSILEGDDLWNEFKIEKQLKHFNDSKVILSHAKYTTVSRNGEVISNELQIPKYFYKFFINAKYSAFIPLLLGGYIQSLTVMIRKEALMRVGKFESTLDFPWVDYPTYLKLSLVGDFYGSKEIFGVYRKHSNSQVLLNIVECNQRGRALSLFYFNKENVPWKYRVFLKLKIENKWLKSIVHGYWLGGRLYLCNKERNKAFNYFLKGITEGKSLFLLSWAVAIEKMKCILGILCMVLNIDFEKFVNLIRKRRISIIEAAKR